MSHNAGCLLLCLAALVVPALRAGPADQPAPRADRNSAEAHRQLVAKARRGGIDVYFLGDSITRRWDANDRPAFQASWRRNFWGWNAADFGWGADRIQNILWRVEHGELDGVDPKVIVLLAGTNNVGRAPDGEKTVADVVRGIRRLLAVCAAKAPRATIILTAIFPRNDSPAANAVIGAIDARLAGLADGRRIRFLDVNPGLRAPSGMLRPEMTEDGLHPSLAGYQVWADGLKPILRELLGPPAAVDHAPPPTGDPGLH